MAARRSKFLLYFGIAASSLGLLVSSFGVLSVLHTSRNVAIHQNPALREFLAEYEGDQQSAFVILVVGLIVTVAGVVCSLVYTLRRFSSATGDDYSNANDRPKRTKHRPQDR